MFTRSESCLLYTSSLEETAVYHTAGRIVRTEDDGRNKTTTFEWDEPGSYSGGYRFFPKDVYKRQDMKGADSAD